jgi:anti-anti-sigma factor
LSIRKKKNDKSCFLQLEGAVDISQATEFKQRLIEAFDQGKKLRLSFEKTTHLDVTAVQLLWAAAQEARRAGVGIEVEGEVPQPILLALSAAGFEQFPITAIPQ